MKHPILPEHLELLDKNMKWVVEPGEFDICIGSSSVDMTDVYHEKEFSLDDYRDLQVAFKGKSKKMLA